MFYNILDQTSFLWINLLFLKFFPINDITNALESSKRYLEKLCKEQTELEIAANDFVCLNFNQDTLEIDNEFFNTDLITIKDLQSKNSKILRNYLKHTFEAEYKAELENFFKTLGNDAGDLVGKDFK